MNRPVCQPLFGADDDVARWVYARTRDVWIPGAGRAIGFIVGERLIAGAVYFRFNHANVELAFASEGALWMSRENIRQIFGYPFLQLKVKRVTVIADANNHASIKLNQYFGFKKEATLTDASPDGDLYVFRMLRNECRWLETEEITYVDLAKPCRFRAVAV